MQNKTKKY